jgi:hypothetical protein
MELLLQSENRSDTNLMTTLRIEQYNCELQSGLSTKESKFSGKILLEEVVKFVYLLTQTTRLFH